MSTNPTVPTVRTGQGGAPLSRDEFERRFRARFADPAFADKGSAIRTLVDVAWDAYDEARKSPRTRRAGDDFFDADYPLSVDWLETRAAIQRAQEQHDAADGPARILLICGAARNDKTCPGEMSKTFRMTQLAQAVLETERTEVDVLDLSALTSEYGKVIYPCKGCRCVTGRALAIPTTV